MSDAFVFGVPKSSWIENSRAMNIWAGFVFFASRSGQGLGSLKLNFLPDALHGLDTGGKNWESVYKHLTASDIADTKHRTISAQEFFKTNSIGSRWSLTLFEETFIHISGVSHKSEFESFGRIDVCRLLKERINPSQI